MKELLAQRRQDEREERLRCILEAAETLFLDKGFRTATMRDICRAARLSTGAVYFYFSGKDEIYSRICEDIFIALAERFDQALQHNPAPAERFRIMLSVYLSFYRECRPQWSMVKEFRRVGLPDALLEKLNRLDRDLFLRLQHTVEDYLRAHNLHENRDSLEVSVALWGSVEGLLAIHHMGFFTATDLDLEKMLSSQLDIFLKGIQ
jgi:AcrR family transcriptional regulator